MTTEANESPEREAGERKCCGVDVRRDYYVDDCRQTLTCPDCGKTFTRESTQQEVEAAALGESK